MKYVLFAMALAVLFFSVNMNRRSVQLAWGLNARKFSGSFMTEFGEYVTFSGSLYMGFDTPVLITSVDDVRIGKGPRTDKLLLAIRIRNELMSDINKFANAELHYRSPHGINVFFK